MMTQKQLIPALLEGKKQGLVLDAAGKYKEEAEAWTANGLNGFIFAGQNIVEKLNDVVTSCERGTTMSKANFESVVIEDVLAQ